MSDLFSRAKDPFIPQGIRLMSLPNPQDELTTRTQDSDRLGNNTTPEKLQSPGASQYNYTGTSKMGSADPTPSIPTKPPREPMTPGSCALRLANLERQTSATRGELMRSIAADICATFISIGRHSEEGNLLAEHTDVIDAVILTIRDTDVRQRRSLENRVHRLHKERNWLRKKHAKVTAEADVLARAYKAKMRALKSSLQKAREELEQLRSERVILQNALEKKRVENGTDDEDADGEYEIDTTGIGEEVAGENLY